MLKRARNAVCIIHVFITAAATAADQVQCLVQKTTIRWTYENFRIKGYKRSEIYSSRHRNTKVSHQDSYAAARPSLDSSAG
jgi:hypothetical protein